MVQFRVCSGVYFLHKSFLKEISEKWITKGEVCEGADLLMALSISNYDVSLKRITCDRTMEEIKKPKNEIGFVPGILDLIEDESLPDGNDLDNEAYSFEVASLKGINTKPTFFIVLDSEKDAIIADARSKGYNGLIICSRKDFDL